MNQGYPSNTDLDLQLPYFQSLKFEVINIYQDWWYTGALLHHTVTDRQVMAVTRSIRGGITLVPDPDSTIIQKLDTSTSADEVVIDEDDDSDTHINTILCSLRNIGFDHWSYQSGEKPEKWL